MSNRLFVWPFLEVYSINMIIGFAVLVEIRLPSKVLPESINSRSFLSCYKFEYCTLWVITCWFHDVLE